MKHVVVLGCGLVGREVARDLARDFRVTALDRDEKALEPLAGTKNLQASTADLATPEGVKAAVADADLVVGALPGFLGYNCLKAVLEAGKSCVDIAFFPEDCFSLDDLAKKNGVTALVDFGVAPGMSNVFAGYHNHHWAKTKRFECLVGGLPVVRKWPFEYKAPFSPGDVIEEYIRPARYLENGALVTRPALSDTELVDFEGLGTLEAFNTDGLRTLAQTIGAPNMKEKTLRYPGHVKLMEAFREAGFFSEEPIEMNGTKIRPVDFTSKILFPNWKLGPKEHEFTVMRTVLEGTTEKGETETVVYELLDRYDEKTGASSMARTTGYTCTAGIRLLAEGRFSRPGICPPEYVGAEPGGYEFLLDQLRERGVNYHKKEG